MSELTLKQLRTLATCRDRYSREMAAELLRRREAERQLMELLAETVQDGTCSCQDWMANGQRAKCSHCNAVDVLARATGAGGEVRS